MEALDSDLAAAFAESNAPVQEQQVYNGPGYATPLRNLVRFLTAVENTSSSAPFAEVWAQTQTLQTPAELTAAMQRLYALPPKQLSSVFSTMTDEQRQYFHAQSIALSEAIKADSGELALAAALLRWIIQAALPALVSFPDDGSLNTTATVRKNYSALDYACRVASSEETNAEMQRARNRIKFLEDKLNKTPAAAPSSGSHSSSSGTSPTVIVLIILFIIALVFVIVFAVLYSKKCKQGGGVTFGGVSRAPVVVTEPDFKWGFNDLIS